MKKAASSYEPGDKFDEDWIDKLGDRPLKAQITPLKDFSIENKGVEEKNPWYLGPKAVDGLKTSGLDVIMEQSG